MGMYSIHDTSCRGSCVIDVEAESPRQAVEMALGPISSIIRGVGGWTGSLVDSGRFRCRVSSRLQIKIFRHPPVSELPEEHYMRKYER